jgi:hypothetical protein
MVDGGITQALYTPVPLKDTNMCLAIGGLLEKIKGRTAKTLQALLMQPDQLWKELHDALGNVVMVEAAIRSIVGVMRDQGDAASARWREILRIVADGGKPEGAPDVTPAKLVFVRGIPGAGKTTFAKMMYPDHTYIDADMFFVRGGRYVYHVKHASHAHAWCKNSMRESLAAGKNTIVANTFVRAQDVAQYKAHVGDICDDVLIVRVVGDHASIHGVPPATIARMKAEWQDLDAQEGEVLVTTPKGVPPPESPPLS